VLDHRRAVEEVGRAVGAAVSANDTRSFSAGSPRPYGDGSSGRNTTPISKTCASGVCRWFSRRVSISPASSVRRSVVRLTLIGLSTRSRGVSGPSAPSSASDSGAMSE
jgi:hypothetical protein